MHFNRAQIIILLVLLSMLGILFYLNYKTPEAELQPISESNQPIAEPFDFELYMTNLNDSISPMAKQIIEEQSKAIKDDKNSLFATAQLAQTWDSLGFKLVTAYYLEKIAQKVNDENSWNTSGNKYYEFSALSPDTAIQLYATQKAISSFEKTIAINENNLDAKNSLAICYVQNDLDVMKGVQLLKDIVKRDSNNIQANYTLGMLSMRSGQMDKALVRFETLTRIEPMNPDFYYFLGQCYLSLENKNKAILAFENFKKLVQDPEAKKNIDKTITNLKNSK
jgi:cytochrome c-type biogenesis protein CcmH/NrfG